ncbi:GINS complex subunit [Rhizophlyctis rosea]|uniref:GINS complex subunit n=1 Tax=Rhizophlyctis rosea TaxID=64517 RepID=A0AAD5X1U4_9FUNG|nr:GINS complex subunit [Rhizophlyctis rosea]
MLSSTDAMDLDEADQFLSPETDVSDTYHNDDLLSLTKWWINERFAPELLPYQGDLVSGLMEMVEHQIGNIETSNPNTPDGAFMVVLYQQEMERIKFVIRSYLRTRLLKKYTPHLLQSEEYRSRMSPEELAFAEQNQHPKHLPTRFNDLIEKHYFKSILDNLPQWLHRLDDNVNGIDMVRRPDLEDAVMCRVKEDIGEFQLDDGYDFVPMPCFDLLLLPFV